MQEALARLDEQDRRVLVAIYTESATLSEIADAEGLTVSQVKTRRDRAKAALQRMLISLREKS